VGKEEGKKEWELREVKGKKTMENRMTEKEERKEGKL